MVILECSECIGPVGMGLNLAFPISALKTSIRFDGSPMQFSVWLHETAGWLKDPQNMLKQWIVPSKCDMIQVLSRLSSIRILGDWTTSHEIIALDNVQITNLNGIHFI